MIDGILRVRVAARPVDGAANEALCRLVADALRIARGRVSLRSGATGRRKVLEIVGVAPAALRSRWPGVDV